MTVSSGAAHTSGAVTISSGAGATTNGGIVVDAKTGAGVRRAITVRQGSSSGDRLVVTTCGRGDCERGEQPRCECDGWRYWIDNADTR